MLEEILSNSSRNHLTVNGGNFSNYHLEITIKVEDITATA